LIATGKYIGEGFDMPRLDTLFLVMPISWKGNVQQYAGRLHRLFDRKEEVQIYDYVDVHIPILESMYQKRLKAYASIGYKTKGTPQQSIGTHSIFDDKTFNPVYTTDISSAQREVIIVSPFLSLRRVHSALNYLVNNKVKTIVITRPIENYVEKDKSKISECIEMLKQNEIVVKTKANIHQKFAIIDQRIIWYGSINLLGYGKSEESIMRIESIDIANELQENILCK
jgi:superfamily II DNA or RNA helicase